MNITQMRYVAVLVWRCDSNCTSTSTGCVGNLVIDHLQVQPLSCMVTCEDRHFAGRYHWGRPSLEVERSPQIHKTFYSWLDVIVKKEEELKRKNQLLTQARMKLACRLIAGGGCFMEGKLSCIPVSLRINQHSPFTSSPASKRLSSSSHHAHCVVVNNPSYVRDIDFHTKDNDCK